nr:hypothetical protein [Nitrosomonas nitrosa]
MLDAFISLSQAPYVVSNMARIAQATSMSFSERSAVPFARLPESSIFFSVKSRCSCRYGKTLTILTCPSMVQETVEDDEDNDEMVADR